MAKLMIVDDEEEVANMIAMGLSKTDLDIKIFTNPLDALQEFKGEFYEIFLIDILMPKMDGFTFAKELRQIQGGTDVAIVMMSGIARNTHQYKTALQSVRADGFYPKPFQVSELSAKLIQLAERVSSARVRTTKHTLEMSAMAPFPRGKNNSTSSRTPSSSFSILAALPTAVEVPFDASRAIVTASRSLLSGTLQFRADESWLNLHFHKGWIVGASDNLRDNFLSERLLQNGQLTAEQWEIVVQRMKTHTERLLEAMLSLGFCKAEQALDCLMEQVRARIIRALHWQGRIAFINDTPELMNSLTLPVSFIPVLLEDAWRSPELAEALVITRGGETIHPTQDLHTILLYFAQHRPQSILPALVQQGLKIEQIARQYPQEVSNLYALYIAHAIRLQNDVNHHSDLIPSTSESFGQQIDPGRIAHLARLYIASGNNHYEFLSLPFDASLDQIRERIEELKTILALENPELRAQYGAAALIAERLNYKLDHILSMLGDERKRQAYNEKLQLVSTVSPFQAPGEQAFNQGIKAIEALQWKEALQHFVTAVTHNPADADYQAYLGWVEFHLGIVSGKERLEQTIQLFPQALRPILFLAYVYFNMKETKRAAPLFNRYLLVMPQDENARQKLLECLATPSSVMPSIPDDD